VGYENPRPAKSRVVRDLRPDLTVHVAPARRVLDKLHPEGLCGGFGAPPVATVRAGVGGRLSIPDRRGRECRLRVDPLLDGSAYRAGRDLVLAIASDLDPGVAKHVGLGHQPGELSCLRFVAWEPLNTCVLQDADDSRGVDRSVGVTARHPPPVLRVVGKGCVSGDAVEAAFVDLDECAAYLEECPQAAIDRRLELGEPHCDRPGAEPVALGDHVLGGRVLCALIHF